MELELLEALRADELYKLQNDAKLRAVEQKVPTYEDFRQLVSVFYLKYSYLSACLTFNAIFIFSITR